LDYDPDLAAPRLADALAWREADFIKRYGGTPVARIGFQRFLRNVRLAAENARSA
jgi:epoxyqueuosine reductase